MTESNHLNAFMLTLGQNGSSRSITATKDISLAHLQMLN